MCVFFSFASDIHRFIAYTECIRCACSRFQNKSKSGIDKSSDFLGTKCSRKAVIFDSDTTDTNDRPTDHTHTFVVSNSYMCVNMREGVYLYFGCVHAYMRRKCGCAGAANARCIICTRAYHFNTYTINALFRSWQTCQSV